MNMGIYLLNLLPIRIFRFPYACLRFFSIITAAPASDARIIAAHRIDIALSPVDGTVSVTGSDTAASAT